MKLPRDLSGNEVVRSLRRLGFEVARQAGSHIRMSKSGLHITIPNHSCIAPKTLQSILKQAHVSLENFLEEI
jgi:predicted RNA binding protein YcfA (HicA-like mRNA interferase family)